MTEKYIFFYSRDIQQNAAGPVRRAGQPDRGQKVLLQYSPGRLYHRIPPHQYPLLQFHEQGEMTK